MLLLVFILAWGFCGGNGIPEEGTEPWRKNKAYFDAKASWYHHIGLIFF